MRSERGESKRVDSCVAVQHHHAHMASCMAEHGLDEPVIGVSFDGTGYGTDGAIWGGEFLVGDYAHFRRAAHLRYVGMPGGDKAIREPWRMAFSHLLDAGCERSLLHGRGFPRTARGRSKDARRGFNAPRTSSAGRLFDAVAALAGVRDRVSFEGQAAVELGWLATEAGTEAPILSRSKPVSPTPLRRGGYPRRSIDTRPLIRAVAAGRPTRG